MSRKERARAEHKWGLGRPSSLAEHALLAGTLPKLERSVRASALAKRAWLASGERPNLEGEDLVYMNDLVMRAENDAERAWADFKDSTHGLDDDGIHKVRKIPRKMIVKANEWADKSIRRALRPLSSRGTRKKKYLVRSLRGPRGGKRRRKSSRGGTWRRRRS